MVECSPRRALARRRMDEGSFACRPIGRLELLSCPYLEMEKVREMLVLGARDDSWLGLPEWGSRISVDTANPEIWAGGDAIGDYRAMAARVQARAHA